MQLSTVKKILLVVLALIIFLVGSFAWIFYGTPIHDLRLWLLEQQFSYAKINHPAQSVLLGRRSYLGPSMYGGACVYATGEVRRSTLNNDNILSTYKDTHVGMGRVPLEIYFTDKSELPYEVPFSEWQEGLENVGTSSVYIVYAETKHHYLGDLRCDD